MEPLRIATRASDLAVRQSRLVAEAIRARHPSCAVELATMTTRGDRRRGPLAAVGGKGLFTRELEAALRRGDVRLAVHSAKDLPAEMDADFAIVAVPARADPRDALVARRPLGELGPRAVVGTGSSRRRAQLLALRGDLDVRAVRGNVETRLAKALAEPGEMDAVVLAMAGLVRSGLAERHGACIHPFGAASFVPAAGQGALAVQALREDAEAAELAAAIDDAASREALAAERHVLRELGADCHSCLAVHVAPAAGAWRGRAMVARPDGGGMVRVTCAAAGASETAAALLARLDERGAAEVLHGV